MERLYGSEKLGGAELGVIPFPYKDEAQISPPNRGLGSCSPRLRCLFAQRALGAGQ
jgi:hypothetical protein